MKNPFKRVEYEDAEKLIDTAFSTASKAAEKCRVFGKRSEIAKEKERIRIETVAKIISGRLLSIVKSYPDLRKVPEIYLELLRIYTKEEELKNALSRINWVRKKILELRKLYLKKLRGVRSSVEARNIRKEFYGRVASLMKTIRKHLSFLEGLKELRNLPDFEQCPTVILCGLPNVGKSSLLWRLTGSKPKIRNYPFTTQGLMLGFIEERGKRIQVIDTPGLLDRPLEKRNKVEKKAIVALDKLADLIIYIFDVSGCTPLKDQQNLFKEIRNFFEKDVIVVANKIDIANEKTLKTVKAYNPILISCETGEGIEKLRKLIVDKVKGIRK
jgi:nucleolar GTP-binding protein